jgi:XTP/dITP diphosphohydrolase
MHQNKVVLATHNLGKLRELRALLSETSLECKSLAEYRVPEVPETGQTFLENALIKARNACRYSGLPSIADDSGLMVDCLQGAPGVHSARFAGEKATDSDNLKKLLGAVREFSAEERTARFQCAMVYLHSESDPSPLISVGTWEGRINMTERGCHGFGYDPVFFVIGLKRTSAELEPQEKNRLSHRGQALRQLVEQLQKERLLRSQNVAGRPAVQHE